DCRNSSARPPGPGQRATLTGKPRRSVAEPPRVRPATREVLGRALRILDRRDAELALLDREDRPLTELVVHEEAVRDVLRLPRRPLHLIAHEVPVRVLHALAVLVDRVADVPRLANVEDLRGRGEVVGDARLHALREPR